MCNSCSMDIDMLKSFIDAGEHASGKYTVRAGDHSLTVLSPYYPEGILFIYKIASTRKYFKIRVDDLPSGEREVYSTNFSDKYNEDIFMDVTEPDNLLSSYPHIQKILQVFFQYNNTKRAIRKE